VDYFKDVPWHEICLSIITDSKKQMEKTEELIDHLLNIQGDLDFTHDEMSEYIETLRNNIQIPLWNDFSKVKPDMMKTPAQAFMVFSEPDHFFTAKYEGGFFYILLGNDNETMSWQKDEDVTHWIPILYPCPY
jgi:hypothetical protein